MGFIITAFPSPRLSGYVCRCELLNHKMERNLIKIRNWLIDVSDILGLYQLIHILFRVRKFPFFEVRNASIIHVPLFRSSVTLHFAYIQCAMKVSPFILILFVNNSMNQFQDISLFVTIQIKLEHLVVRGEARWECYVVVDFHISHSLPQFCLLHLHLRPRKWFRLQL